MSYNGWANKPTWTVALWINNTEGMREAAQEALAAGGSLQDFVEVNLLSGIMQRASLASDLLGYVLAEVNWEEIVKDLKEV